MLKLDHFAAGATIDLPASLEVGIISGKSFE